MEDEQLNKTQLLPSSSFSNEKGFKGRGGGWQIKVGREEDHTSKK